MNKQAASEPGRKPAKGGRSLLLVLGLLIIAAGAVVGLYWWAEHHSPTLPSVGAQASGPTYSVLKGKWLRPDGGYIIDIKDIAADGVMSAAYLNPNPIRVAKAQASMVGNTVSIYVEMRDVNYPGSYYRLSYDPGFDALVGVYYQAIARETYKVYFERVKSSASQ